MSASYCLEYIFSDNSYPLETVGNTDVLLQNQPLSVYRTFKKFPASNENEIFRPFSRKR